METFSPEIFYLLIGVSFIIWLVILYNIISTATHSSERRQIAEMQLKLILSIARKLGVDESQIRKDIGIDKLK